VLLGAALALVVGRAFRGAGEDPVALAAAIWLPSLGSVRTQVSDGYRRAASSAPRLACSSSATSASSTRPGRPAPASAAVTAIAAATAPFTSWLPWP
jgi:hypothetical protein